MKIRRSRNLQRHEGMKVARGHILDAANVHRQRLNPGAPALHRRHLQTAVCIVRRNRLVKPDVLTSAGYNS